MTAQPYMPGFEHERRSVETSQWYTEPELARRIWAWARGPMTRRVIEPSAGSGNLLAPAYHGGADVWAVEIDPTKAEALRARFPGMNVYTGDFLALPKPVVYRFDLALTNPPYEDGQDVAHIEHALAFAPRVVALVLHSMFFSQARRPFWERVEIKRGVRLSKRPKFGERGGERDFVVLELLRRERPRPTSTEQWEWW